MKEPIPSVCNINPTIPQSIENIILKACAKNPKNRYDSVAEMHHDLKHALDADHINDERVVYNYPEHVVEVEEKDSEEEQELKEEIDRSDNRINIALIIVGIVCITVVLFGLIFVLLFTSKTTKEVTVPDDLIGLTEKAACAKLKKLNLECVVDTDYDPEAEIGTVLKTTPKGKARVKEKNSVTIIINSTEDTFEVEDYVGMNIDVATSKLEGYGIRVVKTPKKLTEEDNKEENTVISQSVEAGQRLKKDTSYSVIELEYAVLVSVYPDFTDGTYNRDLIEQFCTDNKITCTFRDELDNNYKEGAIILQSRDIGEEVKPGTTLVITIATNTKQETNEGTEPSTEPETNNN